MLKFVVPALALLMLAVLSACGEAGGDTRTPAEPATAAQTPTTGPTATPTQPPGGAGGGEEYTPVAITTPFPSPPPVPDDWATYTHPEGLFTVRYPSTWFREGGIIKSWDPSTWDKPYFPPDSVKVDVTADQAAGSSGCGGGLDAVPGTSGPGVVPEFVVAPDAASATLADVPGAQVIRLFDPPTSDGLTRIHGISAIYREYCFHIAAYFAQDNPDEETFLEIASSFKFGDSPAIDQKP